MNRLLQRTLRALLLLTVISALGLSAFAAPAQAQRPNVISIAFTQEPDSLNPMYTTQYFAGLARSLYLKGAWDFDDNLNPVPVLATEIPSAENGGISADGKVITIRLRNDAKWSDGTPVTSDDFVFTAEMYASEKNSPLGRGVFSSSVGAVVTAPDAQTVVVTFPEPYAPWAANLFGAVLPAHVLRPVFESAGTLDGADWNTNPIVVNGPFLLKEYARGQFLLFERNPNYVGGVAKLEQILITIVPDEAAQVAAIKAGASDLGVFLAPADALDLQASASVEIVTVTSGYNEGWFFNLRQDEAAGHPALQDVNVRRAISLAIDRQELIEGLLNNLQGAAVSFWDGTPYQDPTLSAPEYNPDQAAALLDAAGWVVGADGIRAKDGVPLKLRYATNMRGLRRDAQQVIEQQLLKVGIAVELINYDNRQFLASYESEGPIARGQFDVAQWAISPQFPDPNTSRFLISEIGTAENNYVGANWSHVRDAELDALFIQQRTTVDYADRVAIFHQISRIVTENVYWMPLWQDKDIWSISTRLSGVKISGGTAFWNVLEWEAK
ncbi:MAG: peptide ABC transporter substrate-binding protein [Chloroflexi bacterium CFX4]|nr:peptide ABC transporter substrate-binding protein [Chloroflexi bacterium CFX4]MDL1923221.1 peptide ABC transporter substrate-binding protein [Chloroflexi bacterium CFX3]